MQSIHASRLIKDIFRNLRVSNNVSLFQCSGTGPPKAAQSFATNFRSDVPTGLLQSGKFILSQNAALKASRQIRREYRAVTNLLHRSGLRDLGQLLPTLSCRQFHRGVSNRQHQPSEDPNKKQDDKDNDKQLSSLLAKAFLWMLTAYMIMAVISLLFPSANEPEVVQYVSWNEFLHQMLAKGEVEEVIIRLDVDIVSIVLHNGAVIKGKKMDHKTLHMNVVDIHKFEEKLRDAESRLGIASEDRVTIVYDRNGDALGKLLASIIFFGVLATILWKSRGMKGTMSMNSITQMGRAKFTLVDPLTGSGKGVHFADVAGLKEAKQEVLEFVDYLKRPEHYRSLGAQVPRGALLLGPPGCGKTLLAKAVATEANVPFLSMNGSEFIEMIGGLGAARVRDLFKEGRKRSPCIIYIDEIDAIGRKRSSGSNQFTETSGEGEQTLNQLLVELDGMSTKEGVIMLASTNRADVLDKALLRPGRFDRHILIDLPVLEERKEIFEQHLKGIVLERPPSTYSNRMSHLSPGFSGADIANVCNEAALHAARLKQTVVKGKNLEYAIERIVGGTEKRNHAMSPEEKRVVAYHESGHALVGWMLQHTDVLLKVTIVPRTNLALGFAQYTPTDQKLYNSEELFQRMCMALGGRVAESLTFNKITTGAQNDLEKVTKMAYAQVCQYGMNQTVGLLSFPVPDPKASRRPHSKHLTAVMDQEARQLIAKVYKMTETVLIEHKDKLEQLAEALIKKETLNYQDVEALIGPPPFPGKKLIDQVEFEVSMRTAAGEQPKTEQGNENGPKNPSDGPKED